MKNRIKRIYASDAAYKQMLENYTAKDTAFAVGLYIIIALGYLGMGIVHAATGLYLGGYFNLISILLCFLLLFIRKQKSDTVGLTSTHVRKGILVGLISGTVFSLLNIIPAIQSGSIWAGFSITLVTNTFYYFIVIGFQEEIVFRGYIQTRLYGVIKSDWLAVLICGLMFAAIHVPFQFYQRNSGNLVDFVAQNFIWLLMTFIWHFVFNLLYRKYNSLTAPTIAHGLMNLSNTLFH